MSWRNCDDCGQLTGEIVKLRKQRDEARVKLRHAQELLAEYESLVVGDDRAEPDHADDDRDE